eukprot:CAMPEP_0185725620 /NCGR_PEP_ID=MMETSP1171-20130828/1833_1 /TAXON_ID=374046 /ORGANISM="Helicotheca tamensis, Strain CCMP826" /LENGTH=163 /DNA_ID=CAMNT_0028393791 /DNA_START=236 /DNA_END=729 /DNA_ORIENTATION=-
MTLVSKVDSTKNTVSSLIPQIWLNASVTFGQVEVRVYGLTLGDNPACSDGPPLTLDWSYQTKDDQQLNDCTEYHHGSSNKISAGRRMELLLERGHTHEEIMQAEMTKLKHQLLRERTAGNLKSLQKKEIEELFAGVRRKYAIQKRKKIPTEEILVEMFTTIGA